MTLKIVFGKPGSGKSYHVVSILFEKIKEISDYEKKNKKDFEGKIYTNLPLKLDIIQEELRKENAEFEISKYVEILSDEFFQLSENDYKYWWDKFRNDSLIVIDEVHKYLGAEFSAVRSKEIVAEIRNYLSMHRHKRQDLIFITQATENINRSILSIADEGIQIFNAKNIKIGFPINISMEDINVILTAFGNKRQVYRAQSGIYKGRSLKFDGLITSHVMSSKIFSFYKSNTLSKKSGDSASLELTKIGAIVWFLKKHLWHITIKIIIIIALIGATKDAFTKAIPSTVDHIKTKQQEENNKYKKTSYNTPKKENETVKNMPISQIENKEKIKGWSNSSFVLGNEIYKKGDTIKFYGREGTIINVEGKNKIFTIYDNGIYYTFSNGVYVEQKRNAKENRKYKK